MSNLIAWGESLTKKQTINICLRLAASTFIVGTGVGLLLIHAGVIG